MLRFFPNAKRSLDSLLNLITDLLADGLLFFRLLFRSRTAFLRKQLAFFQEKTLRSDRISPISGGCSGRTAGAFCSQRDERDRRKTRWFPSVMSSSPPLVRIQQLRPLLSANDPYIRLSGWFISSDRSNFEPDGIIAQHSAIRPIVKLTNG